MGKIKYMFNPETLSYEKIEFVFSEFFYKKVLPHITISTVLGVILAFLGIYHIGSPFENTLVRENNQILLQYDLLDKQIHYLDKELAKLQHNDDDVYRLIFESNPIPASVRKAGFGGVDRYAKLSGYESSPVMIDVSKRIDIVSKQMLVQSQSYDEIVEMVQNKEKMIACIPAIQPISNKDLTRFGSPFGYRIHPIFRYLRMHAGVDLTAPKGTPVYASGEGLVVRAESGHGYGNHIRLSHGFGYATVYAHLDKILVKPGQRVKRGEVIGLVGNTGWSTSPHLHYEVRINDTPVNPLNFYYNDLTDEEYEKMISNSNAETHVFEQ